MAWKIEYTHTAKSQLKKLDRQVAKRILHYVDELSCLTEPHQRGKVLTGPLGGFWRYRVGDYRVICDIKNQLLQILVVKIGHRRDIYD